VYLDLLSIGASMLAYVASSSTFVRSFRLIRVLRVVNNIPALRRTLATVAGALEQIGNVVLLMLIVLVMFAVLCVIPHPHSCISFPQHSFSFVVHLCAISWWTQSNVVSLLATGP